MDLHISLEPDKSHRIRRRLFEDTSGDQSFVLYPNMGRIRRLGFHARSVNATLAARSRNHLWQPHRGNHGLFYLAGRGHHSGRLYTVALVQGLGWLRTESADQEACRIYVGRSVHVDIAALGCRRHDENQAYRRVIPWIFCAQRACTASSYSPALEG